MPFSFQWGLFSAVLILAGVRFERSLRKVVRSARTSGERRPPSGPAPRPGPTEAEQGAAPKAEAVRSPAAFRWDRWHELAILWALILFCAPFLWGVAAPGTMTRASSAVDRALGGDLAGDPPAAPDARALRPSLLGQKERSRLERTLHERTAEARRRLEEGARAGALSMRLVSAGIVGAGILCAAAAFVCSRLRLAHRAAAMAAAASCGLAVAASAFAWSGPASSRLSGALKAAECIAEYGQAPPVWAEDAPLLAGPVRVFGRPEPERPSGSRYLHLSESGAPARSAGSDEDQVSPREGFRVGPVEVAPSPLLRGRGILASLASGRALPDGLVVASPHVRLAAGGRELFIRSDEVVVVMGFLLDGKVAPWPGYPVIVAPAAGEGLFRRLSADLLGRRDLRARHLAKLQIAFGALAAWFLALLLATATERALAVLPRRRAGSSS
jgi:hypothetical protein